MDEEIEDYLSASGKQSGSGAGEVLTAVAMVGAEIGELRAHLGDALQDLTAVREDVTGLHQAVKGLTDLSRQVSELAMVVDELAQEDGSTTPRPVDLAHIPEAERGTALQELADWVHTVLFGGWPWTQGLLRPCWPHHPDLINDLLILKVTYETAYVKGRAHHAVEYRHLLDYVMEVAAERTRSCPTDTRTPHDVPLPPRHDLRAMMTAARDMVLAKVWRMTEQANRARQLGSDELAGQAEAKAAELFATHQITQEEYQAYERRVQRSYAAESARRTDRPADTD